MKNQDVSKWENVSSKTDEFRVIYFHKPCKSHTRSLPVDLWKDQCANANAFSLNTSEWLSHALTSTSNPSLFRNFNHLSQSISGSMVAEAGNCPGSFTKRDGNTLIKKETK